MRVGYNPNKDKLKEKSEYLHQVIIPIYIPNQEGYFKDSLTIFKLCVTSLLNTTHSKTFITIVNNGSCEAVKEYLEVLFNTEKIHELIHTDNIGKLNAILKGLVGNGIDLITISDADVLFLPNWQKETIRIFNNVPKAGVVGIVPQFKMFETYCGNVIFDNLFSKKLKFLPVKNSNAIEMFYESIGWDKSYNKDYLKYNLALNINSDLNVLVGTGHFVATYKRDIFEEVKSFINFKLGGISEKYLDMAPLKKDYWRLTTQDNYAYHMGNTYEDWMQLPKIDQKENDLSKTSFYPKKKISSLSYFIKNRLFNKFISISFLYKIFLKWKGLPKTMIKSY